MNKKIILNKVAYLYFSRHNNNFITFPHILEESSKRIDHFTRHTIRIFVFNFTLSFIVIICILVFGHTNGKVKTNCLNCAVCVKHCNTEFIKQVLPRFLSPQTWGAILKHSVSNLYQLLSMVKLTFL